MKTLTTTTKAATITPRHTLERFTVTTEWVTVTTSIHASYHVMMQQVPSYQIRGKFYCGELVRSYLYESMSSRWTGMECLAFSSLSGHKLEKMTFSIEARHWEKIVTICEGLNCPPVGFIRAAIFNAAQSWRRFDEQNRPA